MDPILQYFVELGYWGWFILGGLLLILEIFAPGTIFLWLGVSAGITGFLALFWPDANWETQWLTFAVLSVVSIALSRYYLRRHPIESDDNNLNQRGTALIGKKLTLVTAISAGRGRAQVDDSTWTVEGPDLPAGTVVVVKAAQGTILEVAPLDGEKPASSPAA
ncbi:NfeD family protein [Oceanibacterium hippocampi]|uniref:Inner membrane protein YbbJ n=1 Tax=Oceanibacterium hippocampi TaxID=745714 RepID=A0A1Y5U200_9PROT|nr:NfeD family protein [Oceanibacterium hippocampi]SLN74555.1 Inner membrane protein YbbJ [Oceanibacterium hippocampi]